LTPTLYYGRGRGPSAAVARSQKRVLGLFGVEQLWNRGGATGGKRSPVRRPENGLIWGETVATGCHRLPFGSHGKQGVCHRPPPVAGGPLSEKEGVEFTDARAVGQESAGGPRESLLHHYAMSAIRARACTCVVRQDGTEAHRGREPGESTLAHTTVLRRLASVPASSAQSPDQRHTAPQVAGPRRRATTPTRASAMSFYRPGRLRDEPRRLGGSRCRSWRPS
jgi:hypothetical protein